MVHVPYRTIPLAITDLLGGQLQVMFHPVGPAGLPRPRRLHRQALVLRAGPSDRRRSGLPGFNVFGWNGVLATGGTPRPVIEKLHALFISAMKDAEVRTRMAGFGFERSHTRRNSAPFVKEDIARWAKLVKETGAKVE